MSNSHDEYTPYYSQEGRTPNYAQERRHEHEWETRRSQEVWGAAGVLLLGGLIGYAVSEVMRQTKPSAANFYPARPQGDSYRARPESDRYRARSEGDSYRAQESRPDSEMVGGTESATGL